MKACPVCLVECPDEMQCCPIDGIPLLRLIVLSEDGRQDPSEREGQSQRDSGETPV